MSDNLKRYRAINAKLMQLFPDSSGRQKQYLVVLAALISGIVDSRICRLWPLKYPVRTKINAKAGSSNIAVGCKTNKSSHQLILLLLPANY